MRIKYETLLTVYWFFIVNVLIINGAIWYVAIVQKNYDFELIAVLGVTSSLFAISQIILFSVIAELKRKRNLYLKAKKEY